MNVKRLLEIPKERLIKKLLGFDEIYTVALRSCENRKLYQGNVEKTFFPIEYSKKYWYADPLIFTWKGIDYLFVEEYDRKKAKGQIAFAVLDGKRKNLKFNTIINEPYHMSFPMVFEWKEKLLMIPETSENRSINIYTAKNISGEWELLNSIKTDQLLVDTIIVEKNDDYLLLLSSEVNPINSLEVRYQKYKLFYRNLNELIPEVEFNKCQKFNLKDRNAGVLINEDNERIIPMQTSSSIDYGVSLSFKKNLSFSCLDITAEDVKVEGLNKKNIIGIHTYSKGSRFEAIDVRYLRYDPAGQYRKVFNVKKKLK